MPHDHEGHDHSCHGEAHDGDHDHDHDDGSGARTNLYPYIDIPNVAVYNAAADSGGCRAIKPWHERNEETSWIESDLDDQVLVLSYSVGDIYMTAAKTVSIVKIPFTGSVKLQSILLKSGPGEKTPSTMRLFANEENVDFSDIEDKEPLQEFHVPQGREIGEYVVKQSKFASVSSLTIFFPGSQGDSVTRVYYIGLQGLFSERRRDPIIAVYESQANLADHDKIQGMDGGMNMLGS